MGERLEAFETMLKAVQNHYQETSSKMETLKANGKVKSATYRQLVGNKIMYQNMLSMYRLYDLLEEEKNDVEIGKQG